VVDVEDSDSDTAADSALSGTSAPAYITTNTMRDL